MTSEEVRAWRITRRLTWATAALFAGVSKRTWARWESGESNVPQWLPRILETFVEDGS
jgi:DNA-binding XRE family transcriptional regulator